jgi:hypothetical protein
MRRAFDRRSPSLLLFPGGNGFSGDWGEPKVLGYLILSKLVVSENGVIPAIGV